MIPEKIQKKFRKNSEKIQKKFIGVGPVRVLARFQKARRACFALFCSVFGGPGGRGLAIGHYLINHYDIGSHS